ncbi:hypothetical protein AGMMS49992_25940 [Clostridia bacterium]|nr:hypothetical protein AGMMS49992_25940 [Clostridia bacterium]
MPKVIWTQAARDKAQVADWEKRFRATVAYHLQLLGLTKGGLGEKLGVPFTTIRLYIREPTRIRAGLMLRLMDELKFNENERTEFFGIKNVRSTLLIERTTKRG